MKKIVKMISVLACLLIGCLFITNQEEDISYLIFDNIEALAQHESNDGSVHCYGFGELDCFGCKVEMRITGLSLDEF